MNHLVDQFAQDANGDRDALIDLCRSVVTGIGAFGSVEKQRSGIAAEIAEDLQAALDQFAVIAADLKP